VKPTGGAQGETERALQHQRPAARHGKGEEANETHVVVQRQPAHQARHVTAHLKRRPDGGEVGIEVAVGHRNAAGRPGRTAGVLEDRQRGRIGRRHVAWCR
jgi:hypothetical protein